MAPGSVVETTNRAPLPAREESRPSGVLLAGALALILIAWSVNYTAGKVALRHMDPLSLVSIRIELAALLMLSIYFLRRRRSPFRLRDAWMFAYMGFLGVILNQGFFTAGLNYTTSERSVLVVALGPILILLFARAMKLEAFTAPKIAGMALAFIGVMLLETEGGSVGGASPIVGDVVTLIGVGGFAVYSVLGKKILSEGRRSEYDAVSFNTFITVAAAVMLLPLAVRQGIALDWGRVGWAGWSGLVYMAAGSSVGAYTLFYWVLRYVEASRVAAINYVQPFFVILLSMVFLGERPTGHLISGGVLVLVGVYFVERVAGSARLQESEGPEAG